MSKGITPKRSGQSGGDKRKAKRRQRQAKRDAAARTPLAVKKRRERAKVRKERLAEAAAVRAAQDSLLGSLFGGKAPAKGAAYTKRH